MNGSTKERKQNITIPVILKFSICIYILQALFFFRQRMKVTENASKDTFELLRLAFAEESEKLDQVKKEVKHSILTGSSKWSAKIDIEVVEAQGLTGKDKSGKLLWELI